jgi:hypothetical protein
MTFACLRSFRQRRRTAAFCMLRRSIWASGLGGEDALARRVRQPAAIARCGRCAGIWMGQRELSEYATSSADRMVTRTLELTPRNYR